MEVLQKHSKGKIVFVKQALVLDSQVDDITDAVLHELGLSTSVQSVQPQDPSRILSNFSNSDDYLHGRKIQQQIMQDFESK